MRRSLLIGLFVAHFAHFFSSSYGIAHWDDQFDDSTGHIFQIVKVYKPGEITSQKPDINDLDGRNCYRQHAGIETARIHFQPLIPSDVDFLWKYLFHQDAIMKYYETGERRDLNYIKKRAVNWVNRWDTSPFSWWTLQEKKSHEVLGALGSYFDEQTQSLEIACLLRSESQRQGYMTEALQTGFMPYALKAIQDHRLACRRITVPIHPKNEKSIDLAKRVGQFYSQYPNSMIKKDDRLRFSLDISQDLKTNQN